VRPLAGEPLTARDLAFSAIAQTPFYAATTGQSFPSRSPNTHPPARASSWQPALPAVLPVICTPANHPTSIAACADHLHPFYTHAPSEDIDHAKQEHAPESFTRFKFCSAPTFGVGPNEHWTRPSQECLAYAGAGNLDGPRMSVYSISISAMHTMYPSIFMDEPGSPPAARRYMYAKSKLDSTWCAQNSSIARCVMTSSAGMPAMHNGYPRRVAPAMLELTLCAHRVHGAACSAQAVRAGI
jgi:hypothetical protein